MLWVGADRCATCSGRVLGFDAAMNFDAFISYASKDKPTADAVCAALEDAQIRCWIAPRDILPGSDWSASIIDALDQCRVMILIFSGNANDSQQIRNEVVHAVHRGVPVIPVRIEDIPPGKSLAYFMSGVHWLDALSPPIPPIVGCHQSFHRRPSIHRTRPNRQRENLRATREHPWICRSAR